MAPQGSAVLEPTETTGPPGEGQGQSQSGAECLPVPPSGLGHLSDSGEASVFRSNERAFCLVLFFKWDGNNSGRSYW